MNILVVEDESILAQTLLALLKSEGYQATWADCLEAAWQELAENEPDLIALDVMLPEGENAGFEFAKALRDMDSTIPILFLTARDTVEDRVAGLDLGGDDYLVKPYSLDEFMARLRALLRRESKTKKVSLQRGDLEVNLRERKVLWKEKEISLSKREFAMLELFVLQPERIYTAEELLERIFPGVDTGTRVVRVYIHYLRQKIAKEIVTTATGGYRLGV
ncbi:MAG TPA: response regulator transcription factor [Trueperaceae bacterium]|nr:response regulator transcription factor [Trueperaceae bacterium]